ncbi:MAG: multidrug ABC transporter permease [Candidatus Altiarchaeales archaeon ex4484_96]|nr:MAG: multidrug ABC transporter permease [Candidatus Altiarchaeales archaeon ex4484_96]
MIQTIYVMWLRQLKRYWRSKPRLIGSIGQPLLFLIAFGFGFSPVFERAGGVDYMEFLVPGIVAMTILFTSMFTGIEVVWDRKFGFLKETLVAPISRTDIMVGRTLGGATISVIQGLVVLLLTLFIGFRPVSWYAVLPAIFFMFLVSVFLTGFGTAIASRIDDMQAFPMIMNLLIMPMFFLSGALFPIDGLPSVIKFAVLLNPLTYGVDGLRATLTGTLSFSLTLDLAVLMGLSVLVNLVGAWFFSKIEI